MPLQCVLTPIMLLQCVITPITIRAMAMCCNTAVPIQFLDFRTWCIKQKINPANRTLRNAPRPMTVFPTGTSIRSPSSGFSFIDVIYSFLSADSNRIKKGK